ncbi:MAG: response regulator [Clostridiaceae bacterium]|nr:response regulator [Clostridiaceae bacterium]
MFKLLVVDDEAIEREALKFIVGNSDLEISEVMEAANGEEALLVAEEFDPDIVTLDIMMPGLNGIEAGRILRERKPEIKIIFVTAYDSLEYTHEAIKIGVEEFIVKPGSNENTLEVLRCCIVELREELQKKRQRELLEGKIKQISGYLKNEFVNSIVNGEIDEHQATEYLEFMLDEFVEGFGAVVEIDFSESSTISHINRTMIRKRFAQQLSALLDKNINFMMNQVKDTIYILVFGYSPGMRSHYIRLIEDEIQMIGEDLNEQLAVKLYYGFGDKYNQISQLWKSFAQAKGAARNMQLSIMENSGGSSISANNLEITENELWHSIFNDMEEVVIQKANNILDNIIFASNDMKEAKLKLYEFFILMSRYLNKESQLKHAVPEDVFEDLKNIESMGEARKYIHGYLYEILRALKEQRSSKTHDIMDKAIEFVHKNYCENLTLEAVAYEIGFSTYYFGKLFKKTYGVSFTDYLTSYRIEQAKKLLSSDPLLTVKGVTYRVGFMDPNYFTRVFKKSEGLTPTEYRTNFLQDYNY